MISAIIVNYRSAQLTGRAVSSVLAGEEETEVFVVDNTAEDRERELLKSLLHPSVTLLFNETNSGFAAACNKAYAQSRGEFVLLLNPDARLLPGSLSALAGFLRGHEKAAAAGPLIYWDDEQKFLLPPSVFPSGKGRVAAELRRISPAAMVFQSFLNRAQSLKVWTTRSPARQKALSGGHVLLRRSAIELAGGLFDDRYFLYYEDSDLMLRLRRAGYGLFVVPQASVVHNYLHDQRKMSAMAAAHDAYFKKNFADDPFVKMAKYLSRVRTADGTARTIDLGKIADPLRLRLPDQLHGGWLFEWSPSPDFIPAVGLFGTGPTMVFSSGTWALLGPGRYYGRISAPRTFALPDCRWQWEKETTGAVIS